MFDYESEGRVLTAQLYREIVAFGRALVRRKLIRSSHQSLAAKALFTLLGKVAQLGRALVATVESDYG